MPDENNLITDDVIAQARRETMLMLFWFAFLIGALGWLTIVVSDHWTQRVAGSALLALAALLLVFAVDLMGALIRGRPDATRASGP